MLVERVLHKWTFGRGSVEFLRIRLVVRKEDFFRVLFEELEIEVQARTKAEYLLTLNEFLIGRLEAGEKVLLIVDEAQNLSPHEVRTIVSRVGDGTKIVLCGDIGQIDSPYLDASSNGLSHVIERMKRHPIAGHVTLERTERSELASIAAELL